jgi:hypothetical protein
MYRDNRGSIYIPHTHQRVPIGTLSTEEFARPPWTFNKVLALEKEGLFEALIESSWPERNDCALLTSKGFFSRAGRDLIDQLPIEGEQLTIYCVHDADAAGTLILQALAGETKARGARLVEVVNLGLDPWDGIAMGLEVESVDSVTMASTGNEKRRPCGAYVDEQTEHQPPEPFKSWGDWLQKWRFELDAMTGPQLAAWFDAKLVDAFGKVIPPAAHMTTELLDGIRRKAERNIEAELLAGLRPEIDRRVAAVMRAARKRIPKATKLVARVERALEHDPRQSWADVIAGMMPGYTSEPPRG